MIIDYNIISEVDLSPWQKYITRVDHKPMFVRNIGEHYKLLYYLASQINNELIVELGTHHGTGTLALSTNNSNKIISYDVVNRMSLSKIPDNVTLKIGNIFNLGQQHIMLDAALIFLDTAHTGDFELEVYTYLVKNNFKGILLLDDIHWNVPMQKFWNQIAVTKYDITDIGHSCIDHVVTHNVCGTGLVDFNGNVQIKKK